MPSAVHSALARGLAVLASEAGNGDTFTLGSVSFSGSLTSQEKPDGIGGRIVAHKICAPRSAFASLPREGDVITDSSGATYRVQFCEPCAGGYFNINVATEVR